MLASRYQAVYTDDSGRLARQQLVAHYPISRVVQTEWLHMDAQNRIHPTLPASLKLVFVFDFDIRHNPRQLLFMYIDSRYPIRHKLLLAGAESVPEITLSRVSAIDAPTTGETTPIYSL